MTASERLERLEDRWTYAPGPAGQVADERISVMSNLFNALPELIAVVKAAESFSADDQCAQRLHDPLAALDRKLSEAE